MVTNWAEDGNPDSKTMSSLMSQKQIFDGRNLFDPDAAIRNGFAYWGIGRLKRDPAASHEPARVHPITSAIPRNASKMVRPELGFVHVGGGRALR